MNPNSFEIGPLQELHGLNNMLTVYEDKIVLSNSETENDCFHKTSGGGAAVQISNITSLQYQKAGLTKGFIQFNWPDSQESENTIEFDQSQNEIAEKVYSHMIRVFRKKGKRYADPPFITR
ncbi:MAG: hypothetical protein FWF88_13610 [Peptococcaceae bacterium]|nr:hypothetical protein [Peptococcaceae bacterium]